VLKDETLSVILSKERETLLSHISRVFVPSPLIPFKRVSVAFLVDISRMSSAFCLAPSWKGSGNVEVV